MFSCAAWLPSFFARLFEQLSFFTLVIIQLNMLIHLLTFHLLVITYQLTDTVYILQRQNIDLRQTG